MKLKGLVSTVGALMLVSPFASAGQPVQMWKCNINGDVNEEAAMAQDGCRLGLFQQLWPMVGRLPLL